VDDTTYFAVIFKEDFGHKAKAALPEFAPELTSVGEFFGNGLTFLDPAFSSTTKLVKLFRKL
jgi:hypothetical protein